MEPFTMALLGASTGLQVLGAYTSGKAAQQSHKAKARELKIANEIDLINALATENATIQALNENMALNLASTSGGESAMAFIEDQSRTTAIDIKRLKTNTLLNRDSKRRSIKAQYQAGSMARKASLIEMGSAVVGGGIDYKKAQKIG